MEHAEEGIKDKVNMGSSINVPDTVFYLSFPKLHEERVLGGKRKRGSWERYYWADEE